MTRSRSSWNGLCAAALAVAAGMCAVATVRAEPSELEPYEAPTMCIMNSTGALARLRSGHFDRVYRGFGSRQADRIDRDELLGFHFMLDTDCQSHGLRALIVEHELAGLPREAALEAARAQHLEVLKRTFDSMESLGNLYENYDGKGAGAQLVDPESHFIFTSPKLSVALFYGPIVMVIEETLQRGMDLNGIARNSEYYTVARFLKNLVDLRFATILADYVADRDEYVLPSYLTPRDVVGLIVHAPSPLVIGGRLAVPPPAVRRVYRKHWIRGAMAIDVFDARERLMARLCASPSAATVEPSVKRSPEELPPAIAAAWASHVERLRRPRTLSAER